MTPRRKLAISAQWSVDAWYLGMKYIDARQKPTVKLRFGDIGSSVQVSVKPEAGAPNRITGQLPAAGPSRLEAGLQDKINGSTERLHRR